MTHKQKKQAELRYTIHRCQKCNRELRSKESISRSMGKSCSKKHQREMRELRELAAFHNA